MRTMRYSAAMFVIGAFAASAQCQFRLAPNININQPPLQTNVFSRTVNNVVGSPFFPNPYYPFWFPDPSYGFLTGASDVINAQGNFLISKRQSQVIREQAEQARLDTRRKA